MSRPRNRSEDLSPAGERQRKSRGVSITKVEALPLMAVEPNPDWHRTAMLVWASAQANGAAAYWQTTDVAQLYLTCEAVDGWIRQGEGGSSPRRSPEMLRTITQSLDALMFTETARRKAGIELVPENNDLTPEMAALMAEWEKEDEALEAGDG